MSAFQELTLDEMRVTARQLRGHINLTPVHRLHSVELDEVFGAQTDVQLKAASTAALLGPLRERLRGRRIAATVCGSNIDAESYARLIAA